MSITARSLQRTSSNLQSIGEEFLKLKEMSVAESRQAPVTPKQDSTDSLTKLKEDLGIAGNGQSPRPNLIQNLIQMASITVTSAFVGFGLLGDKFIKSLATLIQVPLLVLTEQRNAVLDVSKTGGIKQLISEGEGTTDAEAQKRGFNTGYDVVYGYGKYATPEKPLSEMTIAGVQEFQKTQIRATKGKVPGTSMGTGAVGKYQFTQQTLDRLVKKAGIDPTTAKFTPEIQDKLAEILIAEAVAKANGDPEKLADNLAKLWASLPTDTGQGYYEGQGARVSRESLEKAAQQINVGEKLNIQGDPEQAVEPTIVYVPVPIEKEGGDAPPSPTLSDVKAGLQPDGSGPDRIRNGLNAAD